MVAIGNRISKQRSQIEIQTEFSGPDWPGHEEVLFDWNGPHERILRVLPEKIFFEKGWYKIQNPALAHYINSIFSGNQLMPLYFRLRPGFTLPPEYIQLVQELDELDSSTLQRLIVVAEGHRWYNALAPFRKLEELLEIRKLDRDLDEPNFPFSNKKRM